MKTALITGATSGIGEALAHLLHAKGLSLILTGRNVEKLAELEKRLGAEVLAIDLTESREALIKLIREKSPDLVINNAGCAYYGHTLDLPLKKQYETLTLNAVAPLEITLEAAAAWKKQKRPGTVLNISSIAAHLPTPGMSVYGASKAFISKLSQALDFEYRPLGIRVLSASLGMVDTPFMHRAAGHQVTAKRQAVLNPEQVAKKLFRQIQRGKKHLVLDWRYRFIYYLLPFLPNYLLSSSVWKNIKNRL